MKITPENIKQANEKLVKLQVAMDNIQAQGKPISRAMYEERDNLKFIITGIKMESSQGLESNCAFFHLQAVPASLTCDGQTLHNGVFNHPDYSHCYEFLHAGQIYVMEGNTNLTGTLEYRNYQPFYLRVSAKRIWTKEHWDAVHSQENWSLTSAQI